jgi:uncharacterized protein YbjT (DUF2867 family)
MTIAVAGATGALGREVVALLAGRGRRVRALGRSVERLSGLGAAETRVIDLLRPGTLAGVCDGVDGLIVCSGASMRLGGWRERAGFQEIDYLGNLGLLAEARRAGVGRLVLVSLAGALKVRECEYARAHERLVQAVEASGVSHCVVRPTGFFRTFTALTPLAARGIGVVIGAGHFRTNPIHEGDAARACGEALENGERQMVIGGPEVFTRERLAELPFEALGRVPRVLRTPGWVVAAGSAALGWVHPRIGALAQFGAAASEVDLVAPVYGTRRLGDYLRTTPEAAERGRV